MLKSESAWWALLAACFGLTRWWYAAQGVAFQSDTVYSFMQFLDPALLRDRLLESLWYLHAQPPLMNLAAGLAMKAAPQGFPALLQGLFLAVGFATFAAIAAALRGLGFGRWPALAAGLAFVSVPQFVVYENWFFYPHPVLALLACAALCLHRTGGRAGLWLSAAFWCLAALVYLRSVFHPAYFLLAAAVTLAMVPKADRASAVRGIALPAALVALLVVKNLAVLGIAGTSSWGGLSLHKVATDRVDAEDLRPLVDQGVLSPASLVREFAPPGEFLAVPGLDDADRGVPALDEEVKSVADPATGERTANFNHRVYLKAGPLLMSDAIEIARRFPAGFARAVGWNVGKFLQPVLWDRFLTDNRNRVYWFSTDVERAESWALWLFPVAFVWALIALFRRRTPGGERLLLAFATGTILWVTALALLFEIGENNRFRYEIMGLLMLLYAYGARDLWRLAKKIRAG